MGESHSRNSAPPVDENLALASCGIIGTSIRAHGERVGAALGARVGWRISVIGVGNSVGVGDDTGEGLVGGVEVGTRDGSKGIRVGAGNGAGEGERDGTGVGAAEGADVGTRDGSKGILVGVIVGTGMGATVGAAVGAGSGSAVGPHVGIEVGCGDGDGVVGA